MANDRGATAMNDQDATPFPSPGALTDAALARLLAEAAAEWTRRHVAGMPPPPDSGDHAAHAPPLTRDAYITAERAGRIAGVAAKTIYSWAAGQRWASRPTKRTLRISEAGFRAWLAGKR